MKSESVLHNLFDELKRRRVIRVATLYVVVFWPVIQIVDILSPAMGLPDSAMRYLVLAFVAGLPLVLIFAWIFDLNESGLAIDHGESESEKPSALIGSRVELGIIGIMLLVVAGLFYVQTSLEAPSVEKSLAASSDDASYIAQSVDISELRSIAVLPFDIFSEESRDRFFADGLTEELLNVLARVNGLQVAARTSSFAYRNVKKTAQQIGRELNVAVLLEGSVRRNDFDNTVRVTAQLIRSGDGSHIWSRTYDRELKDVFKIQDEIATAVVNELKISLLGGEAELMKSRASASPEAMITYSMGQTELGRRTEVSLNDAGRFFRRAIELDPNYVDAWVGLADVYTLSASYGFGDKQVNLAEAQKTVDKALELDSKSGAAWASRGLLLSNSNDSAGARQALVKALELNPNYAMAHMWYASALDDPKEKFKHFRRAYELDPRSPVAGFNVAQQYIARGRDAEAIDVFSKIVDADPNYARAYDLIANISTKRGRIGDAIHHHERAFELQPNANSAFEIASLHLTMGNVTSAMQWADVARPMDRRENHVRFDWLDAKRYAVAGNEEMMKASLRKLAKPPMEGEAFYLISTYAAYTLGDNDLTIANWEGAQRLSAIENDFSSFDDQTLQLAQIGAAYAYASKGDTKKSGALIDQLTNSIESAIAKENVSDPELWYRYALLNGLRGQTQGALIALQRAVDEGWRDYWQPAFEPVLRDTKAQTEFQSMMAGVQTRMNLMRDQFAFEEAFASAPRAAIPGS